MIDLVNPYWDIVQRFPTSDLYGLRGSGRFIPEAYPRLNYLDKMTRAELDDMESRTSLTTKYAWAIPSNQTLVWIRDALTKAGNTRLVEIGAGSGYWAYMLGQLGIDVVCYDKTLLNGYEKNNFFDQDAHTFHPVFRGTAARAAKHPDRVLFLCWPPYSNDMAFDALSCYEGDWLLYIGEFEGGCCADDLFFQALAEDWEEVEVHYDMIQWSGINDYAALYRRKLPKMVLIEEPD